MKKKWIFAGAIFIFSRLAVMNPGPVFFDSPAYLRRFADPSILHAFRDAHFPLHAGYILFGWPLHSLASGFTAKPEFIIVIGQIILWVFASSSFYKLIRLLGNDKKTQVLSLIFLSTTPLLWIAQVSIMMDSIYIALFIIAWYCLQKGMQGKYTIRYYSIGAMFMLLSLLTHFAGFVFVPALLFSLFMFGEKKKRALLLYFLVGTMIFYILCNVFLLGIDRYYEGMHGLYKDKAQLSFSFESVLIFLRNGFIPFFRSNTIVLGILGFVGWISQARKNFKLFILGFFILAPIPFINQWWDSLLIGRHALLGTVGVVMFAAILLRNRARILVVIFLYLLITVVPAVLPLKGPIPYLLLENSYFYIPSNSLYIESHFARPQIQMNQHTDVIFIDEPGWNDPPVSKRIDNAIAGGKGVYISSQAISEPYGLYSGPYLHVLALSYRHPFILESLLSKYYFEEFDVISRRDNLILYRITRNKSDLPYPSVPKLTKSSRRIDYYDPLTQLWFIVNDKFKLL